MNFSKSVKQKAAEIFCGINFRRYEIRKNERTVTHIASLDPADVLVMIRKYEQRIEWQAETIKKQENYIVRLLTETITKQENYIVRLLNKIEKLESKLGKKRVVQMDLPLESGSATIPNLDPETVTVTMESETQTISGDGVSDDEKKALAGIEEDSIRPLL